MSGLFSAVKNARLTQLQLNGPESALEWCLYVS